MVIIGAMVVMAAFGRLSMLNAALRATLALLLTGCLNLRAAGRGVEFGTLVVLAAAVGLESADSQRPISVSLARQLEVNYMPFANGLMMGASAFISPPGLSNHRFREDWPAPDCSGEDCNRHHRPARFWLLTHSLTRYTTGEKDAQYSLSKNSYRYQSGLGEG